MLDPFQVLGLDVTCTKAELTLAYRKLAQHWHPDRCKDPQATAKFREVREAYELIKGGYKPPVEPTPAEVDPTPTPTYATAWTIPEYAVDVTFEDTFLCSKVHLEGTNLFITVPFGTRDGEEHMLVSSSADDSSKVRVKVRFTVFDAHGFYTVRSLGDRYHNRDYLYCKVPVTLAAMLAEATLTLRNINPNVSTLAVKLTPEAGLIKVPHGGLQNKRGGRDFLFVEPVLEYKALEDEQYHILVSLQEKLAASLASYKMPAFRSTKE